MRLIAQLVRRNLWAHKFATVAATLGVAVGIATVGSVLTLDLNTRSAEATSWDTNPDLPLSLSHTVRLVGLKPDGTPTRALDAKEETHEDYQVMRSAIRLGSLSAFLVGAVIVFFTFRVVIEQRRRQVALLRSLGTTKRQIATLFLTEAATIGMCGAALGLLMTPPLTIAAAIAGVTTTGRAQIHWLNFPWTTLFIVAAVGAATAVLGVILPMLDILRSDLSEALGPPRLESGSENSQRGLTWIALPFCALLYVLLRPFFSEVLPSLAFFVFEAGLVCVGFLGVVVLLPEIVGRVGGTLVRLLPVQGPLRLLLSRRFERARGAATAPVSSVMLVFALLLALHIMTLALKHEVTEWGEQGALAGSAYIVTTRGHRVLSEELVDQIPNTTIRVPFSGRSPWPNSLMAVQADALRAYASSLPDDLQDDFDELGPGKIVLSSLMARRFNIGLGDTLEVTGRDRTAQLKVVSITEAGFVPMIGPYRNSKTYGLLDAADFDLIAPVARPIGSTVLMRLAQEPSPADVARFNQAARRRGAFFDTGSHYVASRVRETDRDFAIFDVILVLTGGLAALGLANHLILAVVVRRREIALLRTLGLLAKQIRRMFMVEAIFVGVLGGLFAVALGAPLGALCLGALKIISAFEVQFNLPLKYAVLTVLGAAGLSALAAFVVSPRHLKSSADR